MKSTANEARRVIRTLRSGAVDPVSARAISIGTEAVESKLKQALDRFASNEPPGTVLVVGDWGAGKSHLGSLLRGVLDSRQIAWVHASVDGKGASLGHLNRAVPAWLEGLRIGPARGIRDAIGHGIISPEAALRWAQNRVSSLAQGIKAGMNGAASGWLLALGHMFATPDASYQHPKALELFRGTANFLADVRGNGGLALLLDEVENVTREHDIRGRKKCYETLGVLGSEPSVLLVLFVTPLFFQQCEIDYARGESQWWTAWPSPARQFLTSVKSMARVKVPPLDDEQAVRLASVIGSIHERAYPGRRRGEVKPAGVLSAWRATATRSTRLLVRMVVDELDIQLQAEADRDQVPTRLRA